MSPVRLRAIWITTTLLQCFDTVGWVIWPVKTSSPKWLTCVEWDVKPCSINHQPSCIVCRRRTCVRYWRMPWERCCPTVLHWWLTSLVSLSTCTSHTLIQLFLTYQNRFVVLITGMGSSRTVLAVEDSLRTKNRGLGLGLEFKDHWPWPWPWPRRLDL